MAVLSPSEILMESPPGEKVKIWGLGRGYGEEGGDKVEWRRAWTFERDRHVTLG